ncbi:MAG: putative Fe-S cluster assembly protein SufT [Gammaproteobacteria bacterium]|nr:putative Fe-S cluster assembly protein SufT [Gammaproteobacteria bacterium]
MFGPMNEPVTLKRDLTAMTVPAGIPEHLQRGSLVYITQAMGGSFTIYFEGNLYRVAGKDADALGLEIAPVPVLQPGATDEDFRELVWDQMRTVYDPEIPINIVDLGLVYDCRIDKDPRDGTRTVEVQMTVTAPGCGMGEIMVEDVREKIALLPTVTAVKVELVYDPPWNQGMMSEAARLEAGLL